MAIPILRYSFACASNLAFDVAHFSLHEALSAPYRLDIELVSTAPAIPFESLLDQPAVLTFWQGQHPVRHVHGIVTGFAQATSGHRHTIYRAVVEPALARAQLRSNWRVYQQRTVPDLLAELLKAQRIATWDEAFCRPHLPREYCVQAGETDLDFFQRLGAEEGVIYAFAHTADHHTPVLTDDVHQLGAIDDGPVRYVPLPGGNADQPHLSRFVYTEQLRATGLIQRDYTFRNPAYDLEHGSPASLTPADYAHYRYPGRYKQDAAGRPFTATHLAALRADAQLALAEGNDPRLLPGRSFLLTGHPRDAWNTHWRVIRLVHEGSQHTSLADNAGAGGGGHYRQQIELVPADLDWKAVPAPKPRIDGPQVATVVGPPNEEIFCDEHGRVRVRFPWDRDGTGTCWIRVAQDWAGAGFGQVALPRVNHEVLVDFLDGDPDQPIITGRQYNARNRPPYPLPQHKTLHVLRSKEHQGGRANEVCLDDTQGQISATLRSGHAASALQMGYLTHPRPQGGAPRGEGFELRTDAAGAVRAAKGLLLTTDGRAQASGGQLSRDELIGCLESALSLAKQLGEAAAQQGLPHDAAPQATLTAAVRDLHHGANDAPQGTGGGQPVIALSAPGGIAAATPHTLTLAAGQHVASVAQGNQQLTAGQVVRVDAGQGIGLFAQAGDLRQIAHQGAMLLQTQQQGIRLEADQSVEVTAGKAHIQLAAAKQITLLCGGAAVTLADGNVDVVCPGTFRVRAGLIDMDKGDKVATPALAFAPATLSPMTSRPPSQRRGHSG